MHLLVNDSYLSVLLQCFAIGCCRLCLLPDRTQVMHLPQRAVDSPPIAIFDHQFIVTLRLYLVRWYCKDEQWQFSAC